MKKTLFTLACAALVAPAFAGEAITEPITITLPDSTTTPTWKHSKANLNNTVSTDNLVTHYQTDSDCQGVGFYVGGNNNSISTGDIKTGEGELVTTTGNVASVTLLQRGGVAGENFVMVLSAEQLVGKVVNTLTLTGTGSNSTLSTIGGDFVVAVYDGTTLVGSQTAHLDSVHSTEPVTTTLTLDNITFTESNRIMIGFRGIANSSTGNPARTYTISGISLTATPEPATATLSLLALAGLASRRRRH